MSRDGFEKGGMSSFHEVARQRGEGLLPQLAVALTESADNEVTKCEIITWPDLREGVSNTMYASSTGASALVLEFPAPRWQRNASARS